MFYAVCVVTHEIYVLKPFPNGRRDRGRGRIGGVIRSENSLRETKKSGVTRPDVKMYRKRKKKVDIYLYLLLHFWVLEQHIWFDIENHAVLSWKYAKRVELIMFFVKLYSRMSS